VDIGRALGYAFEDEEWLPKLAIIVIVTFASGLLLPVLVGFVGLALLAGYSVDLVRNVRDGQPRPLPRWDNYGDLIAKGGNVLVAWFVYLLPNVLVGCCLWLFGASAGDSLVGGGLSTLLICCAFPLILLYNVIVWPMLSLGLARYAEEGNIGVFFQFSDLFATMQRQSSVTLQYILYSFIVNIILGVVGAIPCVGWVAVPALSIPVFGYLIGQYAELADDKPKRKMKPKRGY
jgi:hypothetical protein